MSKIKYFLLDLWHEATIPICDKFGHKWRKLKEPKFECELECKFCRGLAKVGE